MIATILLIEDNEQNRYLATYLLEQHGFNVVAAVDGITGIDLALKLHPELILLDIQLPCIDGYAVARTLREFDELRSTPIVALTSYAMAGDREKALASGCNGYLEKPIQPDTLVGEIKRFLFPSP